MNNLVSKNPIQRFKQGKQIQKFQNPASPLVQDLKQQDQRRNNVYDYSLAEGSLGSGYWGNSPGASDLVYGEYKAQTTPFPQIVDDKIEIASDKTHHFFPKYVIPNVTHRYLEMLRKGYRPNPDGSWKAPSKSKDITTNNNPATKNSSTRKNKKTPATEFKGVIAGGKVLARDNNLSNVINNDQRAQLINSGAFTDSDFSNVQTFQNALNRYFAKDGYGSILTDNKWGNQTATVFQEALRKTKSPIANTQDGVLFQNGKTAKDLTADLYFENAKLQNPPIQNIKDIKITGLPKQPIRKNNFNKSQIRNMISSQGFDPYKYTGSQRKALRLYLNGESDDTSLLDGTDLARFTLPFRKQGGQLISRNPVERFKNKTK